MATSTGLKAEYGFSEEFAGNANIKSREQYDAMYKRSIEDPEGFWGELASELHWNKPWEEALMR